MLFVLTRHQTFLQFGGGGNTPEGKAGSATRQYTATRLPVELVYKEELPNYLAARQRERQLKGWTRAKKEALVERDLAKLKKL